jgi:hypothetical protein
MMMIIIVIIIINGGKEGNGTNVFFLSSREK